jgi:hypothetical protein
MSATAWPSVQRHGLLSTQKLIDLFGLDAAERDRLLSAPRQQSTVLRAPGLPPAGIRDQKPMKFVAEKIDPDSSLTEYLHLGSAQCFETQSRRSLAGIVVNGDTFDDDRVGFDVVCSLGQNLSVGGRGIPGMGCGRVRELDDDHAARPLPLHDLDVTAVDQEPATVRSQGVLHAVDVFDDVCIDRGSEQVGDGVRGHLDPSIERGSTTLPTG